MIAAAEPVVASSALRPLLEGPPEPLAPLGGSRAAAYFRAARSTGLVAVLAPTAVRLPNALVAAPDVVATIAGAAPDDALWVGSGSLRAGTRTLTPRRWFDPRPRLARIDAGELAERLDRLAATLPDWPAADGAYAAPLAQRVRLLSTALAGGERDAVTAAAAALVGLGPGLTPAGDDVVAGTLAALRLLGPAAGVPAEEGADALAAGTAGAGERTTALSAALLAHAGRGEVAAPAAQLLHALTGRDDLEAAARSMLAVGHTSGHDLAVGILAGGRAAAGQRTKATVR